MEEKVQYQSDERLRDVNEVLENCQTRVCLILIIIFVLIYLYQIVGVKTIETDSRWIQTRSNFTGIWVSFTSVFFV